MWVLLAVKFLLAVDTSVSLEFTLWYPCLYVSAAPHRQHYSAIRIHIKDDANKVPEAQQIIADSKSVRRERFHWWLYSVCWDYSSLSFTSWPCEVGKNRQGNLNGWKARSASGWTKVICAHCCCPVLCLMGFCGITMWCWEGCLHPKGLRWPRR